jgi:hypothetical protein
MSVSAYSIAFLPPSGSGFEFGCLQLCRSTANIPVKPSYRRALSTLLPSVSLEVDPFDPSSKQNNYFACLDRLAISPDIKEGPAQHESYGR